GRTVDHRAPYDCRCAGGPAEPKICAGSELVSCSLPGTPRGARTGCGAGPLGVGGWRCQPSDDLLACGGLPVTPHFLWFGVGGGQHVDHPISAGTWSKRSSVVNATRARWPAWPAVGCAASSPPWVEALTGRFDEHHGELAQILLDQIDALTSQIDKLTTRI